MRVSPISGQHGGQMFLFAVQPWLTCIGHGTLFDVCLCMKSNLNELELSMENLMMTRMMIRRVRKLIKKDLSRPSVARPAIRLLSGFRDLGLEIPSVIFEETPCPDSLRTALLFLEDSLERMECYFQSSIRVGAAG